MSIHLCTRIGFMASRIFSLSKHVGRNYVTYTQGQSPQPRMREYFYYIDHQGMVLSILLFCVRIIELSLIVKSKRFANLSKDNVLLLFFVLVVPG